MNLELYQFNRVACRVRRGKLNEWDKIIVREVQEHYAFAGLDYARQHAVVDVGANIGAFSLWVLAQNPDAQVIAVEVDSDNAAVLKLNLAELATIYHNRLGYEQGDFVIEELDYCAGSNRVVRRGDSKIVAPEGQFTHFKEITVKPITLEAILKKHKLERIHVLKLDCEGAEYDIIPHAAIETLIACDHIVGEYHDGIDRFESECLSILRPHFEIKALTKAPDWGRFWLKRWS